MSDLGFKEQRRFKERSPFLTCQQRPCKQHFA